nr:esterase E4-like [Onthophagus taurus]
MNIQITFLVILLTLPFISCNNKRVKRIVGGNPANVPPEDDPVAFVTHARRSATIRGVLEYPHYAFRGIRYAHPPTGRDRFQRPRTYYLEGVYNATIYPPACLQPAPTTGRIVGSEDCLFLNVYTPMLPEGQEGLPVLVWIHPGGFRFGSASQFGVRYLLRNDIIVVSIQYRLGSLGFLSTGTAELPGNAGLFDMVSAIEWTRRYIGFFGGNPHRVTIMGHGSGASSALLVALSNVARGHISGIIAMSGSAISSWAIDNTPAKTAKEVAEYQGCPSQNTLTMIRCLQNVGPETLIKGDSEIEKTRFASRGFISGMSGLLSASPVTEGANDYRSLPSAVQYQPINDLTNGNSPQIPLLTGITKDETKRAVENRYKNEAINDIKSIPKFMEQHLVPTLQGLIGLGNTTNKKDKGFWKIVDPLNFRGYLKINQDNILGSLSAISEATSDALFSLPAFLTADLWSKTNTSTFLYRFNHVGKARKGYKILEGSKLVDSDSKSISNNTYCSHGDDLSYLFEPKNLDGTDFEEPEVMDDEDKKVRDIYTKMIADFVRNGKLQVQNKLIPSFTSLQSNFVEISSNPTIEKDFRFCEMALWAGLAERLQSTTCQYLNQIGNIKKYFESGINSTINKMDIGKNVNKLMSGFIG